MAKAKKDPVAKKEKSGGPAKKPPAKKPAAAAKSAAPAESGGIFVDTSLAAGSAARLLAARVATNAASSNVQQRPESSMFKQMKDGLAKPAGQTISHLLDKQGGASQKKSATPFGPGQQIGRNQTFGADVNRAGVPRRTGGG
jgi:hypothetical protein